MKHAGDRFRKLFPARILGGELPAPSRRQAVKLGTPIVGGSAPLAGNPAFL